MSLRSSDAAATPHIPSSRSVPGCLTDIAPKRDPSLPVKPHPDMPTRGDCVLFASMAGAEFMVLRIRCRNLVARRCDVSSLIACCAADQHPACIDQLDVGPRDGGLPEAAAVAASTWDARARLRGGPGEPTTPGSRAWRRLDRFAKITLHHIAPMVGHSADILDVLTASVWT